VSEVEKMKKDFIVRENSLSKNPNVNFALKQPTFQDAIQQLRKALPGFFFYRGGRHLAIHATSQSPRLIMIEDRAIDRRMFCSECRSYHIMPCSPGHSQPEEIKT